MVLRSPELSIAHRYSGKAIEHLKRTVQESSCDALAYYYFTHSTEDLGSATSCLRSLIGQICELESNLPVVAQKLFKEYCGESEPPDIFALIDVLFSLVRRLNHAFIIIDALDEAIDTRQMLEAVCILAGKQLDNLHLLVSSRIQMVINERLEPLATSVNIAGGFPPERSFYIQRRLQEDPKMRHWEDPIKREIEVRLVRKADSRFHWVICCLDMLKKGRTPAEVQEILQDLPEDMDDIYNNILMSIPDSYVDQASRAFQWIAYSERQLSLEEVAEASILHDESSLDPNDRLPAPYDIVEICSGLVAVSTNAESGTWQNRMSFVHSSVKDFLISDAIKSSAAKKFAMTERDAQRLITKATLNYHLHLASAPSTRQASIPLLEYAEKYWYNHYMSTKKHAAIFNSMSSAVVELFDMRRNESMLKGIDLPISERPEEPESFHDDSLIFPPPLYYASILGMDDVVERLIARGDQVNKTGGFCGTALQAAAYGGHIDIITQLLSRGADVNAVSGHFGDALQAAACRGNTRCVKELLEWRATVGNACGYYGNALQAAASGEHMQEAQLLLEYGADLNGRGGVDDSALIAAALGGHHPVVTLLLENGADPDVSVAREIPTALYAAVACNHRGVVDMLLRFRADPNTKGGMYESALGAAAQQGHVEIVEQLVRKGADIFSDQNIGISALRFAVQCGHGEVVKLFLRRGRNLNLVTPGVSLLMEAVRHKQGSIVQVLLDEGANATTRDTHETTVLIEAAATGQETIVCMLLDDGVDPSKSDFSGQTALMKAVEIEHEGILSLLLQAGAEVGTTDWAGQSALDIARIKGNKDIVGFLEAQGTLMEGDLLAASSDRTFSKGREQSMRRAISGLDSQTLATLFQVLESQRQSIRLLVNEWNRMREERQAERSPRERLPFPVSLSDGPREHREPQSEPRGWQPFLTIDEQNNLERLWRLQYYYGNPQEKPVR